MKRSILLPVLVLLLSIHSYGQMADHVLGIRFGTGGGFGTEVTYQHSLTTSNRIELDLGLNSHHDHQPNGTYNYTSWGLTGLYHWVYPLETNLNWYIGPGGKIGAWNYPQGYEYGYDNSFFLVAAGDIGIEYSFPVGIQVALNARPEFGLINHNTTINIGIAVRYQFK